MKVKIKFLLALILSLLLVFSTAGPALAGASGAIDYVAMGDSGAAGVRAMWGQQPGFEEGSDYGYTDYIARWLKLRRRLGSFNEDYAISGNTAAELAVMTATPEAQQILAEAELVTITIGANDVLGPLYAYYYSCVEGGVELTVEGALAAIAEIQANMPTEGPVILANLMTVLSNTVIATPGARIYVMGYYNPLPFMVDFGLDAAPYVVMINDLIQTAIYNIETMYGVTISYIPTFGIINSYSEATGTYTKGHSYAYGSWYRYPYFPVGFKYLYVNLFEPIADIHLTMWGYAKVGEAFTREIKTDFGFRY
ncbi:MAG: GDSL-type esterase/lipase family protein [Clostridia bacterium]|nr:GDSL-type esterase/lipase family protein [Clostridia bacterium]